MPIAKSRSKVIRPVRPVGLRLPMRPATLGHAPKQWHRPRTQKMVGKHIPAEVRQGAGLDRVPRKPQSLARHSLAAAKTRTAELTTALLSE